MIKLAIILFLVVLVIFILFKFSMNNDFTDNTVIIDNIDYENGMFYLSDSTGYKHVGTLQGVSWSSNSDAIFEIKELITDIRKNSIVFSKNGSELIIWFQTTSGSESLNCQVPIDHKLSF